MKRPSELPPKVDTGNHLQRAITLGTHHFGLWLAAEKDRAIKRSANAAPAR